MSIDTNITNSSNCAMPLAPDLNLAMTPHVKKIEIRIKPKNRSHSTNVKKYSNNLLIYVKLAIVMYVLPN